MLPSIQKHLYQRRRIWSESALCLALFLSLSPAPGGAIDRGKTSYTAEVVCAFRSIEALVGQKPDWVTFVPIDFNTQTLDEVRAMLFN
jgi:hypothetical protein